ncbi:MAG: hypothetical protein EPN97_00875 [Alphaproteobacteria bacterium]|nr:MAG: hypothetical protein EPN97_00875 [Alphaproteobacteria bacterium]
MSDMPMPTPAPEPQKPKKEFLDNVLVKSLLTFIAWLGPLPLAVVLLKCWFNNGAPPEQSNSDPFQSIRHTVMSPTGSTADMMLLLALVPSIVLLMILHRSLPRRIFAVLGLLMIATGELLLMLEITSN